jgi:ABC-type multidrug transport system permease subunit
MMNKTNELLQWTGAFFIGAGHILNTLGSAYHKDLWNILAFAIGTLLFFAWTVRVANKPQMVVNIVALATMAVGLFKALG